MTSEEFFARAWEMLVGRVDAAMSARFFLQPTLAVTFAIRAALRDYKDQKAPFFFWSVFTDGKQRPDIFRQIRSDVGSVFAMALIIDVLYQLWDFHWVYPLQAIIVAATLSLIPYLLIRGPVTRFLQAVPENSVWFYFSLLGIQTIGVIILFWNALPLYRALLDDPSYYDRRGETRIWSLGAIALIQIGYWLRYNLRPPMIKYYNPFLGHVLQFAGRMVFILATSIFSFVFIQARLGDKMVFARNLLALAAIFSLYCYMLEMRVLAGALTSEKKADSLLPRDDIR